MYTGKRKSGLKIKYHNFPVIFYCIDRKSPGVHKQIKVQLKLCNNANVHKTI